MLVVVIFFASLLRVNQDFNTICDYFYLAFCDINILCYL